MAFLIPSIASFLLPVLALGPVPRHIAFIMDGNRRWATTHRTSIRSGHVSGFEALKRVLESCLALEGLECITVYAFAIDNFKRSREEVDALMDLASTRLLELASHGQIIAKHCVRVRIIGRTELLPAHVQEAVHKIESLTKDNNKALLNICIPYAARDEMAAAVRSSLIDRLDARIAQHEAEQQQQRASLPNGHTSSPSSSCSSITPAELDEHLMFTHSPPLDLLVRTSGVRRLSDFMLHQCAAHNTHLSFVDCYWPQFGLRHLVPILLNYQRAVWAGRRQAVGRVGASRRVALPSVNSAAAAEGTEAPALHRVSRGSRQSGKTRSSVLPRPFVLFLFLASVLLLLIHFWSARQLQR